MPYKLIDEFKDILGEDPVFVIRGAVCPLFMLVTWQEENNPLHTMSITKGRDSTIALSEKKYIAIATDKFREYFEGKTSIQKLQDEYDAWEKDAGQYYEEITSTDLTKLSDRDLQKSVNKVNELFRDLVRITVYIENVDLEKILGVTGPEYKDRIDAIWERATEAVFISFEQRRLKKTLDLISSGASDIVRKAKFIYTDYFWTKSTEEISTALEEIREKAPEKFKEYERVREKFAEKKEKHDEWLAILDQESKRIAEFIQLVMHMRDVRKDPLAQMQALLAEISVEMLKRASVDEKLAPFVILYEYIKGIPYLASMKSDIENRVNGCIYIANPDISYFTENCDFETALAEFAEKIEQKTEHTDVINGQVACRGKVTGVVRVVLDPHNDKGFQQGDILVTSMTRPEFVPLMKKAGAVITNEGGITCHAAIVSRELKIPCIIGTKIATKLLKDGDIVEVDADKGIVKILEK